MAKKKTAAKSKDAAPPIEEAMDELQEIVQALESGQEPLDASLQQFERGMKLLRTCHQQLEKAASRIEILTGVEPDGTINSAEFDGTATAVKKSRSSASDDEEEDGMDPASLF